MTLSEMVVDSSIVIPDPWYTPDNQGMEIHRVPTWDEWSEGLEGLHLLQHNLPKIIGDYVNIGEDAFGERYLQALDVFGGYAYQTVANYASICRSVPRERRNPELTMAHYKAIVTLDADAQVAIQERAVEERWTTAELWNEVHGISATWFSRLDRLTEGLAELQGQCDSDTAVEHITQALVELRNAAYYEGEERNVYEIPADTTTPSAERATA